MGFQHSLQIVRDTCDFIPYFPDISMDGGQTLAQSLGLPYQSLDKHRVYSRYTHASFVGCGPTTIVVVVMLQPSLLYLPGCILLTLGVFSTPLVAFARCGPFQLGTTYRSLVPFLGVVPRTIRVLIPTQLLILSMLVLLLRMLMQSSRSSAVLLLRYVQ